MLEGAVTWARSGPGHGAPGQIWEPQRLAWARGRSSLPEAAARSEPEGFTLEPERAGLMYSRSRSRGKQSTQGLAAALPSVSLAASSESPSDLRPGVNGIKQGQGRLSRLIIYLRLDGFVLRLC